MDFFLIRLLLLGGGTDFLETKIGAENVSCVKDN